MKKLLAGLALSSLASVALAGGIWYGVTVQSINLYGAEAGFGTSGIIIVQLEYNSIGTPSCASSYPSYVAIDTSQQVGVTIADVMTRALTNHTEVTVFGTGTCTLANSGIETLSNVLINQ